MFTKDVIEIMPQPLVENHRLWELGIVDEPSYFVRWSLLDKMVIHPKEERNLHALFMNPNCIADANGVKFVKAVLCNSSTPMQSTVLSNNVRHLTEREQTELSALLFGWYLGEVDRWVVLDLVKGVIHKLRPFTVPMWYFMDEPGQGVWTKLPPP